VAGGDHGTHVEGGPHPGSSAPHLPLAPHPSGVAVEGSDAHQGTEALVGESPQLGKLCQEGAGERRSDAGDAAQEGLILTPGGARLDGLFELPVGAGELLLKPPDVGSNALLDRSGDGRRETVVLRSTSMPISWRRLSRISLRSRSRISLRSRACWSGSALGSGLSASAKRART
jgi:hypothetical protein